MKKIWKVILLGALALALLVNVTDAQAGTSTDQEWCEAAGGIWMGSAPAERGAECWTQDSGIKSALGCLPGEWAVGYGVGSTGIVFPIGSCQYWPTSEAAAPVYVGPGYGRCGNEAGHTDESVVVSTCHGASVTFDAGACTGKCTVGPQVLATAKNGLSQLDGDVLGQAYVKLRNPGGGSYTVCFSGTGTIYKWVSGAWVAQATSISGGQSCTTGNGDGNYVLVTG